MSFKDEKAPFLPDFTNEFAKIINHLSFYHIFCHKNKKLAQFLSILFTDAERKPQMISPAMKKFISILFFISIPFLLRAQGRLGLKFSTYIPVYRISISDPGTVVDVSSSGIRPAIGLAADIPLGQSYYIATGAGYTGYPFYITYSLNDGFETTVTYKLQYIQIPLTLRMLTNEITIDKRIYTQIGSVMEVLVYSGGEDYQLSPIEKFNPVTFTFYFGAGLEIHLGTSTTLTLGISYNRGISNLISNDNLDLTSRIEMKRDLVALDIGIRF